MRPLTCSNVLVFILSLEGPAEIALKDSSRELEISFIISLYFVLLIGIETSDMPGLNFRSWVPNTPVVSAYRK